MAQSYFSALARDARCFHCLGKNAQYEIQTYLLSIIIGGSADVPSLVAQAKCMKCLTFANLLDIKVFLLAAAAGFDTDPKKLITGATCYTCLTIGSLPEIQTYLLAQDPAGPGITDPKLLAPAAKDFRKLTKKSLLEIQVMLLAQVAGYAVNPSVLMAAAKCLQCFPYDVLVASEIATIDFLEPIPPGSDRNGQPPPTPPPPRPPDPPPGRGGGIPVCSDTIAALTPVISGASTSATFTVPRTCCKGGKLHIYGSNDIAFGTQTEVGVTNVPNRTANWSVGGINLELTGFAFFRAQVNCNGGGLTSNYSNIVSIGNVEANDWAARVVINGGAMPSQNSINAVSGFVAMLKAGSIWTKMKAVNVFAPDNLIASLTPVNKTKGADPWTNQAFVAGDLTVNGLKGDGLGTSKLLKTGVFGDDMANASAGMTLYVKEIGTVFSGGPYYAGYSNDTGSPAFIFSASNGGNALSWIFDLGTSPVTTPTHGAGYYSANRVAANDHRMFYASSGSPHAQIGATNAGASNTVLHQQIYVFAALRYNLATSIGEVNARISFTAFHDGLAASESAALYAAVQALRTAFGGGFV